MNFLRLISRAGLHWPDAPVRHQAKRRRLKTVMQGQGLVYRAGRLIEHARGLTRGLAGSDRGAFARVHGELFAACG